MKHNVCVALVVLASSAQACGRSEGKTASVEAKSAIRCVVTVGDVEVSQGILGLSGPGQIVLDIAGTQKAVVQFTLPDDLFVGITSGPADVLTRKYLAFSLSRANIGNTGLMVYSEGKETSVACRDANKK